MGTRAAPHQLKLHQAIPHLPTLILGRRVNGRTYMVFNRGRVEGGVGGLGGG